MARSRPETGAQVEWRRASGCSLAIVSWLLLASATAHRPSSHILWLPLHMVMYTRSLLHHASYVHVTWRLNRRACPGCVASSV
jgi:hypothetical protein